MILRGIDFGNVLNSSGARNFDGSGWWYHKALGHIGLDYTGTTFVAKTTTLSPRQGNMLLKGVDPAELLPRCIKVYPYKGRALNAVGLSGPGARALLASGTWHKQERPFFLSFMSVEKESPRRMAELLEFVQLLKTHLPFQAPVGLQINFSCPNVMLDTRHLVDEIRMSLDLARSLDIPLVPKINAETPQDVILSLEDHQAFDAICVSNTIPWGRLPSQIDWKELFGSVRSPLAEFGGGGLSGAPLLPIVTKWIQKLRGLGFGKPIVGGGGILSQDGADQMLAAGADAIELGSVSMLRPWRVKGIVEHVNRKLGN